MKNIIFGTGIVVTLTTLGFVLAGQLELTTFGVINTTVLSILYGWYQKLTKDDVMDIVEEVIKNASKELTLMKHQLIETEKLRDQELKAYQSTVENLRLKLDDATVISPELQKVVEDVVETDKPKRKRNTKK